MKGGTVQINWHGTKPVLTLDFHPISGLLATGGADYDIKLWLINSGEAQKKIPTASFQSSLSYHGSAVNAIRFSPSGEQLASGADGGELIIWKPHSAETAQTWKVLKSLLFHHKDILDLHWSSDSAFLISGSVDNSCIIWDVNKGSVHQLLDAHLHYVQGVAWDPLGKYIASLSCDRTCRIYVNKPPRKTKGVEKMNYVCQHVIAKAEQQPVDDSKSAKNHLFHDETLPSFFRRLAWSPDGSFLLVPAGLYKMPPASETVNTAYVFSRKDLSRPALLLPGASKPVVAVRFCPVTFSRRGSASAGFFKLPHRLIFAVATLNSLYIYDTESVPPIAILAGLHYAAITDIAWSSNAQYLAVSSQDGYCTLAEFEMNELGLPISTPEEKKDKVHDNKSPNVHKPEGMDIETRADDVSVEAEGGKSEPAKNGEKQALPKSLNTTISNNQTQRRITPMEIDAEPREADMFHNNKSFAVPKLEGKVIERTADDISVVADSRKTEAENNEGMQTSLIMSTSAPISTKPTKRRITPMAIDPQ